VGLQTDHQSTDLHAPVVLIVDDDASTCRLIDGLLTSCGYCVLTASHGEEALRRVGEHCPDLIVLDLHMPTMDGWRFRAAQLDLPDPRLSAIPVVVLTSDPDAAQHSENLRAVGLIEKPFDPDAFVKTVRTTIRKAGSPTARYWAAPDHIVQLFDTVEARAEAMCAFLSEGWQRGDHLLVYAKPDHWRVASKALEARGCPVERGLAEARVTVLDPESTVSAFLQHGVPNAALFATTVGAVVHRLARHSGVALRVHDELTDILAEQDNFAGAERLEELWNALRRQCAFTLFCAYTASHFATIRAGGSLHSICGAHARIEGSPPETLWPPGSCARSRTECGTRIACDALDAQSDEQPGGGAPRAGLPGPAQQARRDGD
jgi:CheY-like chemotaxis protein